MRLVVGRNQVCASSFRLLKVDATWMDKGFGSGKQLMMRQLVPNSFWARAYGRLFGRLRYSGGTAGGAGKCGENPIARLAGPCFQGLPVNRIQKGVFGFGVLIESNRTGRGVRNPWGESGASARQSEMGGRLGLRQGLPARARQGAGIPPGRIKLRVVVAPIRFATANLLWKGQLWRVVKASQL